MQLLDKEIIDILDLIFFVEENKFIQKYTNLKNREKVLIIYYFVDLKQNLGENLIKLILSLYNNIIRENQELINLNDNRIEYINQEIADKYIHLISKISFHFNNIELISIKNCKITDRTMISLECLFSNNLKHLFLDNNKISDLTIFNKRQIFNNLEVLDLSYNNITNIIPLVNIQFCKLKKLNLNRKSIEIRY